MEDPSSLEGVTKEFDKKPLKPKLELVGEHTSHVHSIVWEDNEHNEGFTPKELISADSERVIIWDLKSAQIKSKIEAQQLLKLGDDIIECTVVKRDPHHQNLLCLGIQNGFY